MDVCVHVCMYMSMCELSNITVRNKGISKSLKVNSLQVKCNLRESNGDFTGQRRKYWTVGSSWWSG